MANKGRPVAARRVAGQRASQAPSLPVADHHNPWPIRAAVIGAVATLLATLGGLYFSALASFQATEQAGLAQEQARQAQEAQTSERFSRSVEQLGSDSVAVRIGAVYSFDRLMRDSEADDGAIVEILSSFVVLQAAQVLPLSANETTRTAPVDLLAALQILGAYAAFRPSQSVVLSRVDLSGFDFRYFAFSMPRGDFAYADLSKAELPYADLTDAHLPYTHLSGAELWGAHLSGAFLYYADLSGAKLHDADLSGADLGHADLSGADLSGANLSNSKLLLTDLSNADLSDVQLLGVDLTGVICSAATTWPEDFQSRPLCG